jgi:hypothetical protein
MAAGHASFAARDDECASTSSMASGPKWVRKVKPNRSAQVHAGAECEGRG